MPKIKLDLRTATLIVAASDSLHRNMANYPCGGAADDVQIQAALTAAAGGRVVLLEGTYNCIADLLVPANTTLEGQGFGTILNFSGAAITNAITLNGDNAHVKNLKAQLAAGAGAGGSRPNVVYANAKTLLWLENLWLVGDTTVADDGSDFRQNGVYFETCTYSKIVKCQSQTNRRHGIHIFVDANHNVIENNSCQGNMRNGILITAAFYNAVIGNICQGNGQDGIYGTSYNTFSGNACEGNTWAGLHIGNYNAASGNTCNGNSTYGIHVVGPGNTISGNSCQGNTLSGIYIDSDYNTISDNICKGNTQYGIYVCAANDDNAITGNTCDSNGGAATYSGILLEEVVRCVITGNLCRFNGLHGIYIRRSSYCTVTGNGCHYNRSGDGINVHGDGTIESDYNTLTGNVCTGNASDGIEIVGGVNANKNIVLGNQLFGNTGLALNDAGALTQVEESNPGIEITDVKKYLLVKNTSGGASAIGDVARHKAVAAGNEYDTPAANGEDSVLGMVAEVIADNDSGYVQVGGKTTVLKSTNAGGNIVIGDYLCTENGVRARLAGAGDMAFARALEACAAADCTIDARIISPIKI